MPLFEEVLQERRETLGDRHADTLLSIYRLAELLEEQGKLVEAIPLYTEGLEGYVLLYGTEHWETRLKAGCLVFNLLKVGQQEEADALADKHGLAGN